MSLIGNGMSLIGNRISRHGIFGSVQVFLSVRVLRWHVFGWADRGPD